MENKKSRKISAIILALVILLTVLPLQVFAESTTVIDSGYCGRDETAEFDEESGAYKNLTWTLYDDNRLVISGNGAMQEYQLSFAPEYGGITDAPWAKYASSKFTSEKISLEIENGVTTIGLRAFEDCDAITGDLIIPDSVITVRPEAFMNCTGLNGHLTLGKGITDIGSDCFDWCGFIGNLVIPDSVTELGYRAFYNCSGFSDTITIGSNVQMIGDSAFFGCNSVSTIISKSQRYTTYEGILYNADMTELIYCPGAKTGTLSIPETVKQISDYAFKGCDKLSGDLIIPNGVQAIGERAFNGCSGFAGMYFKGNAPSDIGYAALSSNDRTLDRTLYYIPGTSGWTDSADYDAIAGTWKGYKLEKWDGITLDEPSEWAKDEVNAAIETGLVPTAIQKNYNKPVTRGEVAGMFITLLEKSYGKSVDEIMKDKGVSINENAFTDTNDKAVLAANALGIINGVGKSKFSPNGTLKRAQIAAIINRVAMVMGVNTKGYTHSFTDIIDNYAWADTELGWPVSVGIIKGVGDGRFNPGGDLTTEQAIAITYRAYNVLIKNIE